MLKWYRVSENSLSPLLHSGDYVLAARLPLARIRPGDVVVLRHPDYGTLIKQVEQIDQAQNTCFVVGLNTSSIDSRTFGPVPRSSLLGKVILKVRQ